MNVSDPAYREISFPGAWWRACAWLVSVCHNPVEARLLKCMCDCQVCVCVCVDRAGGWAQGPADWGAAQTLSQMPPGRTDRPFVHGAQRAGPGTHSLNTATTMKHNTHTHIMHTHLPACTLVCAHTYSTVH